jgi:ankyrin repeat protein
MSPLTDLGGGRLMVQRVRVDRILAVLLITGVAFCQIGCTLQDRGLISASCGGYVEVVKFLLAIGADVNAKDEVGMTALGGASIGGHIKIVRLLLDNGADVNARDKFGGTALILASLDGHTEIMALLLDKGADVNAKANGGWTVLTMACGAGHLNGVKRNRSPGSG